jgi:SPP1 gp7 family putative phage head morphogenesis protein
MAGTLASIRRGYANNWTMQQVMAFITGASVDTFVGGLYARYLAQELSLTATLFQHVSTIVQAEVASSTTNKYEWVSILDNRTTVICWNRNGTIYVYGEGPLPPAHWNCRSKVVPYFGESVQLPSSYYSWLKDQPNAFQNDALGESVAAKLRSGELNASDFAKISTKTPLSLEQFLNKIQYMIGEINKC